MIRNRELLLIRRSAGLRNTPGGVAEVGGSVLDAARRTLPEETGLCVPDATLLDVFSGPAHQHTCPDDPALEWVGLEWVGPEWVGPEWVSLEWVGALSVMNGLPIAVSPASQASVPALCIYSGRIHPGATP